MADIQSQALGMIETKGFAALVEASDAMVKAARVQLKGWEESGGGYATAIIRGDVAAVQAALDAGSRAGEKAGEIISVHLIPRPASNIDAKLPLNG